MKKTYQQPATIVCSIGSSHHILAGSVGLFDGVGDPDVQLSRRKNNGGSFEDDEDDSNGSWSLLSYNIWED